MQSILGYIQQLVGWQISVNSMLAFLPICHVVSDQDGLSTYQTRAHISPKFETQPEVYYDRSHD